jgi:hypothetical protein
MTNLDSKKRILIALVAQETDSLPSLHRLVNNSGVKFSYYPSLQQLKASHNTLSMCSGIVLDLQTTISASTEEKDFIRAIKRDSKVPVLEVATHYDAADSKLIEQLRVRLDHFVSRAFDYAAETNLREHPRKPVIMKVKIKPNQNEGAPLVKAVTSDLSEGGCFVVSCGDWSNLKEVFLEFNDSGILIPCQVVWDRKWENVKNRFPGFGAKFSNLDQKIKDELDRILAEQS